MPQKPDGSFARMQTLPTCNQILHIAIEALFTCCFISESTNQILNTCSSIQTEWKCLVRCPERYRLSSTERHQNSQISYVAYVQSRVYLKLKLLNRISSFLRRDVLLRIYKTFLIPKFVINTID